MAKCWLCGQAIEIGAPVSNNLFFGAAHPACDDGFVMGWNAYRAAVAKREKRYGQQETPADSNETLGLKDEAL